jgi:hypothetical protein
MARQQLLCNLNCGPKDFIDHLNKAIKGFRDTVQWQGRKVPSASRADLEKQTVRLPELAPTAGVVTDDPCELGPRESDQRLSATGTGIPHERGRLVENGFDFRVRRGASKRA